MDAIGECIQWLAIIALAAGWRLAQDTRDIQADALEALNTAHTKQSRTVDLLCTQMIQLTRQINTSSAADRELLGSELEELARRRAKDL